MNGSKRMTDRNVGVQFARKRGGVRRVCMKLPVPLKAARILIKSRIMLAGLKDDLTCTNAKNNGTWKAVQSVKFTFLY